MKVLLVLAGIPPDTDLLKTEMSQADIVIAVDGGSQVFLENKLKPDLLIGDLDSHTGLFDDSVTIICADNQNFTDLEKALEYLFINYSPRSLVLLGATGGRTDHLLNNLHICASVDLEIDIIIRSTIKVNEKYLTETITRIAGEGITDLPVRKGATVSVLPVTHFKKLDVTGLEWDICGVDSSSKLVSQSNIVKSNPLQIKLLSGCVYIVVYQ
ncbi:MAG: thiamine diphosphokinase [Candidatus Marinimicrobia bacterium]|nr:thiamine diphosphokinase [Candidatus Neomarinimicrobiota bacterium]